MVWALGLRSYLKDSLHLRSEILPSMLIRLGLGHSKEAEKRFGDLVSEDIVVGIVGLAWEGTGVKGQRFSGYSEDFFFLH